MSDRLPSKRRPGGRGRKRASAEPVAGSREVRVVCRVLRELVILRLVHRFSCKVLDSWVMDRDLFNDLYNERGGSMADSFLGKAQRRTAEPGSTVAAGDGEWQKEYPAVHEFLTATRDADGLPRQTATLLLFTDGPVFTVCLNDRHTNQMLWGAGRSVAEALLSLEAELESDDPQWKVPKAKRGR